MNELDTLVFLGLPKVGRKTVKKIIDLKTINTPIEKPGDYINILQTILPKVADSLTIQDIERAIYYAKKTIDDSSNKGIEIIGYRNPLYPELLKRLEGDAPVILYAKGNISVLSEQKKVAVIGTRQNSDYGYQAGRLITSKFVEKGYVIVSGLAIGCDTIAHRACLDSGGKTIAVMAGGLDSIYPRENKNMAEEITKDGCLISEYPIGTKSLANFFVERDRIQSGLSSGVVVIETNVKGGTLHTVKFGTEQGRSVACIKYKNGYELPSNAGNRMLINNGTAFPLDSTNIDSYLKTLDTVTQGGFLSGSIISNEENNNTHTKSSVLDSVPELEKRKTENVHKVKEINIQIEKLKLSISRLGGNADGQMSFFQNERTENIEEVDRMTKQLGELENRKKLLIEENKKILETVKNTK